MHDSRADEETRDIGRQSGSSVPGTRPLDRSIIDYRHFVDTIVRKAWKRERARDTSVRKANNIDAQYSRSASRDESGHRSLTAACTARVARAASPLIRANSRARARARARTQMADPECARALAVAGATRILDACTYLLARRQDSTYNGIAGSFSGGAHTHAGIPREPRIAIVCRSAAQVARRYLPEEVNRRCPT